MGKNSFSQINLNKRKQPVKKAKQPRNKGPKGQKSALGSISKEQISTVSKFVVCTVIVVSAASFVAKNVIQRANTPEPELNPTPAAAPIVPGNKTTLPDITPDAIEIVKEKEALRQQHQVQQDNSGAPDPLAKAKIIIAQMEAELANPNPDQGKISDLSIEFAKSLPMPGIPGVDKAVVAKLIDHNTQIVRKAASIEQEPTSATQEVSPVEEVQESKTVESTPQTEQPPVEETVTPKTQEATPSQVQEQTVPQSDVENPATTISTLSAQIEAEASKADPDLQKIQELAMQLAQIQEETPEILAKKDAQQEITAAGEALMKLTPKELRVPKSNFSEATLFLAQAEGIDLTQSPFHNYQPTAQEQALVDAYGPERMPLVYFIAENARLGDLKYRGDMHVDPFNPPEGFRELHPEISQSPIQTAMEVFKGRIMINLAQTNKTAIKKITEEQSYEAAITHIDNVASDLISPDGSKSDLAMALMITGTNREGTMALTEMTETDLFEHKAEFEKRYGLQMPINQKWGKALQSAQNLGSTTLSKTKSVVGGLWSKIRGKDQDTPKTETETPSN